MSWGLEKPRQIFLEEMDRQLAFEDRVGLKVASRGTLVFVLDWSTCLSGRFGGEWGWMS